MSDYLANLDKNNLENTVRDLARRLDQLEQKTVNCDSLDEITDDMGLQSSGEFPGPAITSHREKDFRGRARYIHRSNTTRCSGTWWGFTSTSS